MAAPQNTPQPYSDNYLKDVQPKPGFFDSFRYLNFPTLYPSHETSVTADVLFVGWIFAAVILAFSLLLVVPGIRRYHRRLSALCRIVIAVGFWAFIILCNFGQDWEVGDIKNVRTPYKAMMKGEINASIGLHIGLRSINITLLGQPRIQTLDELTHETIDYNERFSWDNYGWLVGRAGFGSYAGRFNQEFREAQFRGLPYPILWIAEYFTFDGEGIRWGRFYLQAGYFAHIFVWTGWALWMLTIILFNMVPRYGGYFSCLTGLSLIVAVIIYGTLRNANTLVIPFEYEGCTNSSNAGDGSSCFLKLHWAWCFWLCLATGICCVVIGVVVIVMDLLAWEQLMEFFNVDVSQDLEEFVITDDSDLQAESNKRMTRHKTVVVTASRSNVPSSPIASSQPRAGANPLSPEDIDVTSDQKDEAVQGLDRHGFRKRTFIGLGNLQKTRKIVGRPESVHPPMPGQEVSQPLRHPPPKPGSKNGEMVVTAKFGGYTGPGANADAEDDDDNPRDYVNIQRQS